ncbi:MAG TPA: hypothetical protein VMN39_06810, partial [Longimicrobiaceae bacterium]|nr:hypothetical protein [Longimicrobiaceae bacterium]
AARLYEQRQSRARAPAAALYNAGTAGLSLAAPDAAPYLLQAARAADTTVAHRANYNLGYHYLSEVREDLEADSAITLVRAAIDRTRAALKLDPSREDARWNLALAQMRLDSLTQLRIETTNRSSAGDDETPIDLDALARGIGIAQSGIEPENARASEVLGQRLAATQGAREAWASQDPGPITEAAAGRLLERVAHDPEQLVRGLMWSHRPNVAWWISEPYPGGNW